MEGRVTSPNFLKFLCGQGGQQWQITNMGYLISPTVSLANKDEGQRQQGPTSIPIRQIRCTLRIRHAREASMIGAWLDRMNKRHTMVSFAAAYSH